jgi:hypothetical protein
MLFPDSTTQDSFRPQRAQRTQLTNGLAYSKMLRSLHSLRPLNRAPRSPSQGQETVSDMCPRNAEFLLALLENQIKYIIARSEVSSDLFGAGDIR